MDTARVAPENTAPLLCCRIFLKGDFKGGHAMKIDARVINITGKRFTRLVAIRPIGKTNGRLIIWECQCDCGKTHHALYFRIYTRHLPLEIAMKKDIR